jgi:hypothetical protein
LVDTSRRAQAELVARFLNDATALMTSSTPMGGERSEHDLLAIGAGVDPLPRLKKVWTDRGH